MITNVRGKKVDCENFIDDVGRTYFAFRAGIAAPQRGNVFVQVRENDFWDVHGRDRSTVHSGSNSERASAGRSRQRESPETATILHEVHFRSGKVRLLLSTIHSLQKTQRFAKPTLQKYEMCGCEMPMLIFFRDKPGGNFANTRQVLDEMGYDDVTYDDLKNVQNICHLVGKRAAFLASAGEHASKVKRKKLVLP